MKFLLSLALFFAAGQPINAEQVELFDTDQEKVVEYFTNTDEFQAQAKHILNSVTGRVLDLQPVLEHAFILKVPLVPPQKLSVPKASIEDTVAELFVVMPKQGVRKPWLILRTKKEETLLVEFSQGLDQLHQLIHAEKLSTALP